MEDHVRLLLLSLCIHCVGLASAFRPTCNPISPNDISRDGRDTTTTVIWNCTATVIYTNHLCIFQYKKDDEIYVNVSQSYFSDYLTSTLLPRDPGYYERGRCIMSLPINSLSTGRYIFKVVMYSPIETGESMQSPLIIIYNNDGPKHCNQDGLSPGGAAGVTTVVWIIVFAVGCGLVWVQVRMRKIRRNREQQANEEAWAAYHRESLQINSAQQEPQELHDNNIDININNAEVTNTRHNSVTNNTLENPPLEQKPQPQDRRHSYDVPRRFLILGNRNESSNTTDSNCFGGNDKGAKKNEEINEVTKHKKKSKDYEIPGPMHELELEEPSDVSDGMIYMPPDELTVDTSTSSTTTTTNTSSPTNITTRNINDNTATNKIDNSAATFVITTTTTNNNNEDNDDDDINSSNNINNNSDNNDHIDTSKRPSSDYVNVALHPEHFNNKGFTL